jgi:hypothetical protein
MWQKKRTEELATQQEKMYIAMSHPAANLHGEGTIITLCLQDHEVILVRVEAGGVTRVKTLMTMALILKTRDNKGMGIVNHRLRTIVPLCLQDHELILVRVEAG